MLYIIIDHWPIYDISDICLWFLPEQWLPFHIGATAPQPFKRAVFKCFKPVFTE